MLLFALWLQALNATQVQFTAGYHSQNMPEEYIGFFNWHDFIPCFIAKNVFVIFDKL